MRTKITVIGGGNVGATCAQRAAEKEVADVVLVDIIEGLPQGKSLDLCQAAAVEKHDSCVLGTNQFEETRGSHIIIVTAGLARKPGMSRDDLLKTNAGIVQSVVQQAAALSPEAVLIVVSNPLDAMCHVALKASGYPSQRVIGMAGVLDSSRFRYFIADALNVSIENTSAFVLGGHGDTMVPLPRYSTVAGIPITELMSPEQIKALCQRTASGGAEIVSLLKTGSAFFAPASAAVEMADAILNDKKKIMPCAVYLTGQYGYNDLFIGVPVKLGAGGAEEVIEIKLTAEEKKMLDHSADAVRALVADLKRLGY